MDYWRQLGIFNPKEYRRQKITLIGAGAIGSMTTLILSKMGLSNIKIYDADTIEEHNLPNQMFPIKSKGQRKVTALAETIRLMNGSEVETMPKMWDGDGFDEDSVVIVATDNMESRQRVWKSVRLNPSIKLYIDSRMGGEVMRIYTLNPMSMREIEQYERTLYSDEEAEDRPCTEQSIIYNLSGVAGFIGSQIKKKLKGEEFPNEIIFDYKCMVMETRGWT